MAKSKWAWRWFAVAAWLVATVGAGVFCVRVVLTGLERWPEPAPADSGWPWGINVGWLVLFALHHSLLARSASKRWLTRWFPEELERSLYVAVSGLLLLGLTLTWQTIPGEPLWRGPIWIMGIAVLGMGVITWCLLGQDLRGFLGLSQAWNHPVHDELRLVGLYRILRHPLMLGLFMFLWGQPIMTPTLALIAGGLTVYIMLALPWEERDLVCKFGRAYEEYRRRVWTLIPWIW